MWVFLALACARAPAPPAESPPGDAEAAGFSGTVVFEPTSSRAPARVAVVVLHGSEGGRAPYARGLAQHLADIAFLRWFEAGPAKGLPVVVYGASRGAEQALLLASLLGDTDLVDGVASHAGTDTVVAGFDPATGGPIVVEGGFDAAWTWEGAPLYGERALPFGSLRNTRAPGTSPKPPRCTTDRTRPPT